MLNTKKLIDEARVRIDLSDPEHGMGLVSKRFLQQLDPFDKAEKLFAAEFRRKDLAARFNASESPPVNYHVAANVVGESPRNLIPISPPITAAGAESTTRERRNSVVLPAGPSFSERGSAVVSQSAVGKWMRNKLYWVEVMQEDKNNNTRVVA
jgi:hypothetical protein